MAYCTQCGFALEEGSKFCKNCGASVAAVTTPAQAVYTEPVQQYEAPVTLVGTPVVSTKDKVFGFVGMGLGIGSLVMAILGLLYTLLGMVEVGLAFGMSIGFGIFSAPMGFIGRSMCRNSAAKGNLSRACSVGSSLSVVGIIISFVMLLLGTITLAA